MNILAIGAHPDDIELGCGGTLARYHTQGAKSYLLVMTKGEEGGAAEVRQKEQMASLGILGGQTVFFADYADTGIPLDKELIERIETVLQEVQPHLIFAHYPEDTHQDHRTVAAATISATRCEPCRKGSDAWAFRPRVNAAERRYACGQVAVAGA